MVSGHFASSEDLCAERWTVMLLHLEEVPRVRRVLKSGAPLVKGYYNQKGYLISRCGASMIKCMVSIFLKLNMIKAYRNLKSYTMYPQPLDDILEGLSPPALSMKFNPLIL